MTARECVIPHVRRAREPARLGRRSARRRGGVLGGRAAPQPPAAHRRVWPRTGDTDSGSRVEHVHGALDGRRRRDAHRRGPPVRSHASSVAARGERHRPASTHLDRDPLGGGRERPSTTVDRPGDALTPVARRVARGTVRRRQRARSFGIRVSSSERPIRTKARTVSEISAPGGITHHGHDPFKKAPRAWA